MKKISFSLAHKYKQFFHCSLLIIHYSLNIYAFSIRTESLKSSKSISAASLITSVISLIQPTPGLRYRN